MIYWKKVEDEYLTDVYYSLQTENETELAYLWYDYFSKKWFLSPSVFKEYVSKKTYRDYGISEKDIEEIQLKATLDFQADLNKVLCDCSTYCDEITNLVNRHLMEELYEN